MNKFSVLLSVYKKEKPSYLDQALKSVYFDQTLKPNEIVLVKDGELTSELELVINKHKNLLQEKLVVVGYKLNKGLGFALNYGLKICSNELIARFDTDDICMSERFKLQINEFRLDKELTICGTQIIEIFPEGSRKRLVPESHKSILKRIKYSSPFNHMTVMFRKSKILECGGYLDFKNYEDYFLWIRLLSQKTCKAKNITYVGVRARVDGFDTRRRGLSYIKSEIKIFKTVYSYGFTNIFELNIRILLSIIIRLLPPNILKTTYNLKSKFFK